MHMEEAHMELAPRKWGWRSLVGAWGAYWAGLAAVTLAPFGVYVWKLTRLPENHGTVSLSVSNAGVHLTALRDGATVWDASVGIVPFALWLALPPLAMWVLWLVMRPAPRADVALPPAPTRGALDDGAAGAWAARDASDAPRAAAHRRDRAP
jgi:hypothetical protein